MSKRGYGIAFATGAALMYGFDPDHGRRRRAVLRNGGSHLTHMAARSLQKATVDGAQRIRGAVTGLRQRLSSDRAVEDDVLRDRVRAAFGRYCSHPSVIAAAVHQGDVELSGPILEDEADEVIAHVRHVPGVRSIQDRLERHPFPEGVPALQGSRRLPKRGASGRDKWPISLRWALGTGGAALAISGLSRGGPLGAGLAIAGASVVLRATANRSLMGLLGIDRTTEDQIDVWKTITIDVPVEEVFDYFVAFENLPKFMRHVREVQRVDDNRWHWKVEGPAGVTFDWDGIVTLFERPARVAWTSTEDATVRNHGEVRFESISNRTSRLTIRLAYGPPFGAIGHAVAKLFGADPKRELDDDMLRFKSLLETGKATGREGTALRKDFAPAKA
jgi:uncharacterized membrane protein